jgi:hypothetical protein
MLVIFSRSCPRAASLLIAYAAADPDAAAYGGATPCSASAAGGHVDALMAIISGGCDTARLTGGGYTALEHAAMNGHAEAVKLLCKEGGGQEEDGVEAVEGTGNAVPKGVLNILVPGESAHPGAGSYTVDGGLVPDDERRLFSLFHKLVEEQLLKNAHDSASSGDGGGDDVAGGGGGGGVSFSRGIVDDEEAAAERGESERTTGVERVYVCDAEGWIRRIVTRAISSCGIQVGIPPHGLFLEQVVSGFMLIGP